MTFEAFVVCVRASPALLVRVVRRGVAWVICLPQGPLLGLRDALEMIVGDAELWSRLSAQRAAAAPTSDAVTAELMRVAGGAPASYVHARVQNTIHIHIHIQRKFVHAPAIP